MFLFWLVWLSNIDVFSGVMVCFLVGILVGVLLGVMFLFSCLMNLKVSASLMCVAVLLLGVFGVLFGVLGEILLKTWMLFAFLFSCDG